MSENLSHEQFLQVVRSHSHFQYTLDRPRAFTLAAGASSNWKWSITALMNLCLTFPAISVLTIVAAIMLRNAWILLAIPAAVFGSPGVHGYATYRYRPADLLMRASPSIRRRHYLNRFHQSLDIVVIGVLIYSFIVLGWQSPVFLVSLAYFITWAECVLYHWICEKAFFQMIVKDAAFYNAAIQCGAIEVQGVNED